MDWDKVVDTYTAAREGLSVVTVKAADTVGGSTASSGGGGMFTCNRDLRGQRSDLAGLATAAEGPRL